MITTALVVEYTLHWKALHKKICPKLFFLCRKRAAHSTDSFNEFGNISDYSHERSTYLLYLNTESKISLPYFNFFYLSDICNEPLEFLLHVLLTVWRQMTSTIYFSFPFPTKPRWKTWTISQASL